MSSAIYPDPPRLVTAVCGHGEQQRLSNARLRLTFYNAPVAYCGPARPGSAFQQSAVSGLLPRARARREIPKGSCAHGVNINQNAIFLECFMDELAQAVGQDELEFRRKLMGNHPRNLAVLNAVAERIGWGKPAPQGVYRGLAHMKAFDAYVAAAAEISVTGGNKIKVHRIV